MRETEGLREPWAGTMTKAWWLGFPRFRCPHCGVSIDGVKFVGHFKLPRVKKKAEVTDEV